MPKLFMYVANMMLVVHHIQHINLMTLTAKFLLKEIKLSTLILNFKKE